MACASPGLVGPSRSTFPAVRPPSTAVGGPSPPFCASSPPTPCPFPARRLADPLDAPWSSAAKGVLSLDQAGSQHVWMRERGGEGGGQGQGHPGIRTTTTTTAVPPRPDVPFPLAVRCSGPEPTTGIVRHAITRRPIPGLPVLFEQHGGRGWQDQRRPLCRRGGWPRLAGFCS